MGSSTAWVAGAHDPLNLEDAEVQVRARNIHFGPIPNGATVPGFAPRGFNLGTVLREVADDETTYSSL